MSGFFSRGPRGLDAACVQQSRLLKEGEDVRQTGEGTADRHSMDPPDQRGREVPQSHTQRREGQKFSPGPGAMFWVFFSSLCRFFSEFSRFLPRAKVVQMEMKWELKCRRR